MEAQQPGQVVSPSSQPEQPKQPETPAPEQVAQPQPEQPAATFQPETEVPQASLPGADTQDVVAWTASEYIAHHKPAGWYVALVVVTVLAAAGIYFMTDGDIISVAVVVLVAIIFAAVGARKPREQQYSIGDHGLSIGAKTYGFEQFKSFTIIDDGAFSSITFMPMKRFMPAISIYYDPQDEDRIVEVLSLHLPIEHRQHDAIDRFMKKIRF